MAISRAAGREAAGIVGMALLTVTGCASSPATPPDPPAEGTVLDAAEVLTQQEEQALNTLIEDRNGSTDAARVAVLTVPDAPGSIEDFAQDVAAAWGVGEEGADNGVLVVADTGDRELRIETADGVREAFSDDEAEGVVEEVLEPAFADERYAQGLTEAVDRIYRYAKGQEPLEDPVESVAIIWVVAGVAALVAVVAALIATDARRRRRIAEEEIREAERRDPDLRLTEQQRRNYRKYRYYHRGNDAVSNPAVWLPLYIANPALYSGGSTGSGAGGGSSFGGGGGFTGGGASGSY